MEQVTGIGGVFLRGRDEASLRAWYAANLGIDLDPDYGGGRLGPAGDATVIWAVFPRDTGYFGRASQSFMINYRVSDLDAMLAQLRAAGAEVDEAVEETPEGRFGWAADPEGNRFELWQPPASLPQ
jgi:catechol 2,3-dioxygenase-like lactoylglutathione lyase family enzyme